jgi:hypothetical protein
MPGALALGLLASLFTHTVLFGNDHTVGGAFHTQLLQAAILAAAALTTAWLALAWNGRGVADGSILGARLAARLPSWPAVAGCAIAWYALIEAGETPHGGVGIAIAAAALAAGAALVCRLAQLLVRCIAAAVVLIARAGFAPRTFTLRPPHRRVVRLAGPSLRRRFARPPPIASLGA